MLHRAVWALASFAILILASCGVQTTTSVCSVTNLATSASPNANFRVVPVSPYFTIYPGGTTQVAVYVQPVNGAQGTVSLSGIYLPQGVTVTPVTASIGSTAQISVTAAPNVVSSCFQGIEGVFTADAAVTLSGASSTGTSAAQVAMNVDLENRAYAPAAMDLAVVRINTAAGAPVDSEDIYVDATLTISDAANPAYNYTGTMGIKGHGNSTWNMPKKPYRLNLDSKAPLLGMTSDSNWILLANYDDKSLLRNDVSFYMSDMLGMTWTPHSVFVELYLNGLYEGSYQLTEKVEVSKARLNIGSMDDTDNSGTDLTGGYLAEIDHYSDDTLIIKSPNAGLPIGLDDPDPPTTTQANYFQTAFNAAETSLYSSNFTDPTLGWQAYWDESSLVNWFLIEEIAGNQDANDQSSDFFYKPRGDARFYRGPVWDMDVTFGNDNAVQPISSPNVPWVSTQAAWYAQLFKDPAFVAAVKARYKEMRPQLLTLPAYIDTRTAAMSLTQQNNFGRWPILGEEVWPNQQAAGTYQGEISFFKNWFTERMAYMDATYLQ